jgi:hypothetical protein
MNLPRFLAISGILLGPKIRNAAKTISNISPLPKSKNSNLNALFYIKNKAKVIKKSPILIATRNGTFLLVLKANFSFCEKLF